LQGKKLLTRIIEHSLTHSKDLAVPFMKQHPEVLAELVKGYARARARVLARDITHMLPNRSYVHDDAAMALCCDTVFRACIRDEKLCESVLKTTPPLLDSFFKVRTGLRAIRCGMVAHVAVCLLLWRAVCGAAEL
jgi:hypothetical protein